MLKGSVLEKKKSSWQQLCLLETVAEVRPRKFGSRDFKGNRKKWSKNHLFEKYWLRKRVPGNSCDHVWRQFFPVETRKKSLLQPCGRSFAASGDPWERN